MAFVCIVFGALGYLLLQHGVLRSTAAMTTGIVLLVAAGLLVGITLKVSLENYILFSFCALATGGGVAFLTVREPVYAALGFCDSDPLECGCSIHAISAFCRCCYHDCLCRCNHHYLLVCFDVCSAINLETYDLKLNNPVLAAIFGGALLVAIVASLQGLESFEIPPAEVSSATRPLSREVALETPSSTAGLGRAMFTEYLYSGTSRCHSHGCDDWCDRSRSKNG